MGDFNYAAGKVLMTTKVLATNPHDVKTRLIEAYNKYFVFVFSDALPDDLKPYLESIHNKMTEKGCEGPEGKWPSAAHHTLHRMHKKTAAKIAEEIFNLHQEIEKRR